MTRETQDDDEALLREAGYAPELDRRMGAFSNFAISLSTICILAGGLTSFHVGLCSVGGAAIGLGWPLCCLFSLVVAVTMAQVASAFPTAGGPYHWASILGGRGWGWLTACLNLVGLLTVLAAVNVGTCRFVAFAIHDHLETDPSKTYRTWQILAVALITFSQALLNHRGIRLASLLTDASGYLILGVSLLLTVTLLGFGVAGGGLDPGRLVTFANYSGPAGSDVWPETNGPWLFLLGMLLPAYTLTGFDASAHTAEETVRAGGSVPHGIVRAVWVSGLAGWVMLAALVLAIPNLDETAKRGEQGLFHVLREVVPQPLRALLYAGIVAAQYLCGLATLTSASRMTFAFARDGGLPFSSLLRRVNPADRCPSAAVWAVALATLAFAIPLEYETVAAVCAVFLYLSYVLPTALGVLAHGRTWTRMGPWHVGRWYRPLGIVCVLGCGLLLVIGVQPPNQIAVPIVAGSLLTLAALWFGHMRRHFPGPPAAILHLLRVEEAAPTKKDL